MRQQSYYKCVEVTHTLVEKTCLYCDRGYILSVKRLSGCSEVGDHETYQE